MNKTYKPNYDTRYYTTPSNQPNQPSSRQQTKPTKQTNHINQPTYQPSQLPSQTANAWEHTGRCGQHTDLVLEALTQTCEVVNVVILEQPRQPQIRPNRIRGTVVCQGPIQMPTSLIEVPSQSSMGLQLQVWCANQTNRPNIEVVT